MRRLLLAVILFAAPLSGACAPGAPATLRLATTTSVADSGLLDAILPGFEAAHNVKVDVIAVGTGQALALGRRGDADVLLVHSRAAEEQFVADGEADARTDVMYNDFVIVGPREDPAAIAGMATAADAFRRIMEAGAAFASRGDKSGTHVAELGIWVALAITPTAEMPWYNALGQGMGDTLLFAEEQRAYALTDRATYLAMRERLPGLVVLVGGANPTENRDPALRNEYGVLAVSPQKHPGVNHALALAFIRWLISAETQAAIARFGVERYGQPLFYPAAPGPM